MAENDNPTAGTSAGTPPPAADRTDASGNMLTLTQDALNAMLAKERRGLQKQLSDAQKALDEAQSASKTEHEKALDAVRKEVAAQYEAKIIQQTIDAELRVALISKGLDPDLAYVVKAKREITDPTEIGEAIEAALGSKEWAKPRPATPAQVGTPTGAISTGGKWTREKIEEFIRVNGHIALQPHLGDIRRDMGQ